MSEKLSAKQYAEQLLYKPEYAADKQPDVKEKAAAFAEGYKNFLDHAKTEREAAATSEQMLLAAGYKPFEPKKTYAPGEKIYFIQEHKAVVAATIGQKPFEEGFRLVIAHIDSPRLDLRPNPLYESDHLSYFKTHYYGGIRKYQWGTMPLAIHGVFTRADGSSMSFSVGEDENDPVFCITDLLPHLGAEQNDRKLSDGIKAEELNVLIGSDAVEEEDVKEAVKLNTLILLHGLGFCGSLCALAAKPEVGRPRAGAGGFHRLYPAVPVCALPHRCAGRPGAGPCTGCPRLVDR